MSRKNKKTMPLERIEIDEFILEEIREILSSDDFEILKKALERRFSCGEIN